MFLLWIALSVLLLFSVVVREVSIQGTLRAMTRTARDIARGQTNRRFRIYTSHRQLRNLGVALNVCLESFHATRERMAALEKERQEMIANISHDLRTPLTALLGYVEALRQDPHLTPDEAQQYIDIIANKGQRMAQLIEAFFELAKLEEDPLPVLQRINLSERLREAILSFYHAFEEAGITPELAIPEEPVYIWGEATSIERILNNLLANALRYGKDGGVIGVRLEDEETRVRVDVWDRGPGIGEEDLPFVFDRLYTGEASRNSSLRGTGLGLTIAKKLVERQRGAIAVHSKPHEQTTFSFWLMKAL